MAVADCRILEWPIHRDARGQLVAVEHPAQVPFPISRVFTISAVPSGVHRGGHAHRTCHELITVVGGSVRIVISDSEARQEVVLDSPGRGMHLAPGTWIEITHVDPGAVCVVLCSHPYEERDYIRDPAELAQRVEGRTS